MNTFLHAERGTNIHTLKHNYRQTHEVLGKAWNRGATPLYPMPFLFDIVRCALIFVSAPLC